MRRTHRQGPAKRQGPGAINEQRKNGYFRGIHANYQKPPKNLKKSLSYFRVLETLGVGPTPTSIYELNLSFRKNIFLQLGHRFSHGDRHRSGSAKNLEQHRH
ncbi:MAG: hypothetical protein QOH39_1434 [Verrucomicrobiota bacterium]